MLESCGYILDLGRFIDLGLITETPHMIYMWNKCIFLG